LPHNKIVLLTTGSQGEPTSALVRITNKENSQIRIVPRDTVVMSATPIPGNEALVNRTIDNLFRQGAQVIYERLAQVHVHGHGSQEELKLLLNLVKPKFFVPIHGEYRHLCLHAKLATKLGIHHDNIFTIEDGDILEIDQHRGKVTGKLSLDNIYIDGAIMRDMAGVVLKDRKLLSRDGIVVVTLAIDKSNGALVGRTEIISKGFIDTRHGTEIIEKALSMISDMMERERILPFDVLSIKSKMKDMLSKFFHEHTKRRPMMQIAIIEV
jgi:ribonuclease J